MASAPPSAPMTHAMTTAPAQVPLSAPRLEHPDCDDEYDDADHRHEQGRVNHHRESGVPATVCDRRCDLAIISRLPGLTSRGRQPGAAAWCPQTAFAGVSVDHEPGHGDARRHGLAQVHGERAARMSGTAERTHTPVLSCCKVASTRLAAVGATPVTVPGYLPAATVSRPLRLNTAGPVAFRTAPPAVFSASTPTGPGRPVPAVNEPIAAPQRGAVQTTAPVHEVRSADSGHQHNGSLVTRRPRAREPRPSARRVRIALSWP